MMTSDPTGSFLNVVAAPLVLVIAIACAVVGIAWAAGGIAVVVARAFAGPIRRAEGFVLGPIYGVLAGVAVMSAVNFDSAPRDVRLETIWPLWAGAAMVPVLGVALLLLCRAVAPRSPA